MIVKNLCLVSKMTKKVAQEFLDVVSHLHAYDLNIKNSEIYLHSHHAVGDEEGGIEYRMATQFIKNLHLIDSLNSNKTIVVHLQSPGGDWMHGIAIYDAICAAQSKVNIIAYGEVSSMSSILYQAAHKRIMMPTCEFMIHRGFLSLEGVASTVQSNAAWNKKTDEIMLQIYANRAVEGEFFKKKKMNKEDVIKYIDNKIRKLGDWNLNAEEAVFYGLADCVLGSSKCRSLADVRK
jgi:ATP-dependent Clp protease protease subunit